MAKINVAEWLECRYSNLAFNVGAMMAEAPHQELPRLATILVGDRKDSEVYVKNKEKSIHKACMTSETLRFKDGTSIQELIDTIVTLNEREDINGILLQLPLNREYYSKAEEDALIHLIDPLKDVDGLTLTNQGKLFMGHNQKTFLTPCTPTGIVSLLKNTAYGNSLQGRDIIVVGRSQLLGNSLAQMLMRENANVTLLHSKSGYDLNTYLYENTSIGTICLCAGVPNLLTAEDCENNNLHTIIDAAINVGEDGKLRGDFKKEDYDELDEYSIDYTSVPGGVGPITTFTLAYNLYKATCLQNEVEPKDI